MRVSTPTDIGLLIREKRKKSGLDQRALAERVGVSRQWIVEIEKGKPGAEIGLILRTVKALDLDILVEEKKPMPEINLDALLDNARGGKA